MDKSCQSFTHDGTKFLPVPDNQTGFGTPRSGPWDSARTQPCTTRVPRYMAFKRLE